MNRSTLITLMDTAFHEDRPGDILLLAIEVLRDDPAALLRAAGHLRNLMAYAAVAEVCDRILQLQPDDYRALEIQALAVSRLRPDAAATAEAILTRAAELARGKGESSALLGRLHKQAWRAGWFRHDKNDGADHVEASRMAAMAAIDHLFRAVEAYKEAFAQSGGGDFYPAVNALTLISLAQTLIGADDPRERQLEHDFAELARQVATRGSGALQSAGDDEARYWAAASRAELRIAASPARLDPVRLAAAVQDDLRDALRYVGSRMFALDSTLQQIRMMSSLGFRPPVVSAALDVLEHAWRIAFRPDLPAPRVVFLDATARREAPSVDYTALAGELGRSLARILDERGDCLAHVRAEPAGIVFSEACQANGIPYLLHLPVAMDAFVETHVRPLGEGWVHRFEATCRAALFRRSGDRASGNLVLPGSPGDWQGGSSEVLDRWMLASARAYGLERVVLVVLTEATAGTGLSRQIRHIDEVRSGGGSVIEIEVERAAAVPQAEAVATEAPSVDPHVGSPDPDAEAESAEPFNPTGPLWLLDLAGHFGAEADAETRQRWQRYQSYAPAWGVLGDLQVRFEPVEQLTPEPPYPMTIGFEVLGMSRDGQPYGTLLRRARGTGIELVDLDLTILALGLQTIALLRQHLQHMVSGGTSRLFFTLNLNQKMIRSSTLRFVLDRYFDPMLTSRILLELSEDFPEELRGVRDPPERKRIVKDAIGDLRRLTETYSVQLILDDSDQIDAGVRAALQTIVCKTKADALYTANVFNLGQEDQSSLIQELAKYRFEGKPYVIEGVETQDQVHFLRNRWPARHEQTGLQGWAIRAHPPLQDFFEPLHTTEQPRGYRLSASVTHRIGPR